VLEMENKLRKARNKTNMRAARPRVNERGHMFFIFLFSYLLPHDYSLKGFASGNSLTSLRIALNVVALNDRQKCSRANSLVLKCADVIRYRMKITEEAFQSGSLPDADVQNGIEFN